MSQQDLPPDFDNTVRLFPLPDLVLFPHNILPLHIFESRYREMMKDALGGDRLIAMATLLPGFERDYHSRPPIAPTVCIGRVTDYETTDEGTYNLMLQGTRRARVETEIEPVRSFRRANVTLISDEVALDQFDQLTVEQLTIKIRRTLPLVKQQLLRPNVEFSRLIDVLSFHLPLPVDVKLKLLAEAHASERARMLLQHWPLDDDEGNDQSLPVDFSRN